MDCYFTSLFIILLLLSGCRTEEKSPVKSENTSPTQLTPPISPNPGCTDCHRGIRLDPNHALLCTSCHGGHDMEGSIDKAHVGLIAKPGHPAHMEAACGTCHKKEIGEASHSLHFTLSKEINETRAHFGARNLLTTPADLPVTTTFSTPLVLADDMLRRRCLRCHVYASGDSYAAVFHGTGCSACHLSFNGGKLQSHIFSAPTDSQCLSCHYGNYVGNDYYGRYEHDFDWDFRTPFRTDKTLSRPYGVETHDLVADIHQQRGLTCIDCHQDSGHNRFPSLTCSSCHDWRPGQPVPPLRNIQRQNNTLVLKSRLNGKEYSIPPLQHPAHKQYQKTVACQVCHAQWSFNDSPTHLLLSKTNKFAPWERLTVQSSFEVETLLEHNLSSDKEELPPTMRDGMTGESRPGIWYLGYGQRRWENMIFQKDTDGMIKVFRPVLDLRLSMVQADGQVLFDNIKGAGTGLRPYTPHTTGHAGLFYRDRFKHLLIPDRK